MKLFVYFLVLIFFVPTIYMKKSQKNKKVQSLNDKVRLEISKTNKIAKNKLTKVDKPRKEGNFI